MVQLRHTRIKKVIGSSPIKTCNMFYFKFLTFRCAHINTSEYPPPPPQPYNSSLGVYIYILMVNYNSTLLHLLHWFPVGALSKKWTRDINQRLRPIVALCTYM